jgi:channel protein (hemolysin III family)
MSEPLPTPDRVVPASGPAARVRPRFRGVVHQWSFFGALVAGAALVVWAPAGRATVACAIYAAALAGLLGTSALYHRVTWRPGVRAWLRRLDHSMIFILIAGTYTPFAVLVLDDPLSSVVLAGVWGGAAAGIVFTLLWIDAPKWLVAAAYIALGWFSIVAIPHGGRHLRAPAAGPASGHLRLPRDLPRAGGRGGGGALRRDRGVRGPARVRRLTGRWPGRRGPRDFAGPSSHLSIRLSGSTAARRPPCPGSVRSTRWQLPRGLASHRRWLPQPPPDHHL